MVVLLGRVVSSFLLMVFLLSVFLSGCISLTVGDLSFLSLSIVFII